jgi:hypothetical protein
LNLNVPVHALVLDGVLAPDGDGGVSFRAHERHDDDVGPLLVVIQRLLEALLHRRGVPDDREGFEAPDRWAEDAPTLAGLAAASVGPLSRPAEWPSTDGAGSTRVLPFCILPLAFGRLRLIALIEEPAVVGRRSVTGLTRLCLVP